MPNILQRNIKLISYSFPFNWLCKPNDNKPAMSLLKRFSSFLNKPYGFHAGIISNLIIFFVVLDVIIDLLRWTGVWQVRIPVFLLSKTNTNGAKLGEADNSLIFQEFHAKHPIILIKWRWGHKGNPLTLL